MSSTAGRRDWIKHHARGEFENWAGSYDRSWLNELVFFPSVRACQEEIERWRTVRGSSAFDALDVGCGTGNLVLTLARHPAARRLVGLDFSRSMAGALAGKIAAMHPPPPNAARLWSVVADSERLPFGDESFDVVTCCNSFHHYPHQAAVIVEFRRVLRPGGIAVLIDGFRDNVVGWVVFDVLVAGIERHVHHAPWSQVRSMLSAAGFAAIQQRKLNVLAPLLVTVATR